MRGKQIQNRLSWRQGVVSIALLLTACSQPQVSQTTQEVAPETEEVAKDALVILISSQNDFLPK
ncbi:MAG: hypothetical protein F6K21_22125 [Symploca sp. SIO2D2]|nr:hypothetical protein [Symploca sp. SIO2D2]